jgi:hypothetical protein
MIYLIWLHFIADFLCQNDKMALKKSSSNKWLGIHCLIYGAFFLFYGIEFAVLAGLSHFVIDWTTSRINKKLWTSGERHWFFTMIGFDQALHLSVLYGLMFL